MHSEQAPNDIQVQVQSEYVPDQSSQDENRYVFTYHVVIENCGKSDQKPIIALRA